MHASFALLRGCFGHRTGLEPTLLPAAVATEEENNLIDAAEMDLMSE